MDIDIFDVVKISAYLLSFLGGVFSTIFFTGKEFGKTEQKDLSQDENISKIMEDINKVVERHDRQIGEIDSRLRSVENATATLPMIKDSMTRIENKLDRLMSK